MAQWVDGSVRDGEVDVGLGRGQLVDVDAGHAGVGRPVMEPRQQRLDVLLRSLRLETHGAVGLVPHPADQPETLGLLAGVPAERHALDHAVNGRRSSDLTHDASVAPDRIVA